MKRNLILCLVFVLLGSAQVSLGQDLDKATETYNRGDYQTALRELKPLAEQGHPQAQYNLGFMYDRGEGVPQDDVYVHMWFNIAAAAGNEKAKENRDVMKERMTPAQIAEAKRLARECVARDYKGC